MDVKVERGRQGWACSGLIIGEIPELHVKNWFHRRGGWSDDVVAFFYIFNSNVFPVELKIFQEAPSRKKIRRRKNRSLAGLDESDRRWRWTDCIQGEFLLLPGRCARATQSSEKHGLVW